MCVLWACTESVDDRTLSSSPPDKELLVLFGPDTWGDQGYNDLIFKGLLNCVNGGKLSGVKVRYYNPASMAEAEKLISAWKSDTLSYSKRLLVFANDAYKDVVTKHFATFPLDTAKNSILLFESDEADIDGVHTFYLSLYGTSYIAGAIAAKFELTPLVVLGSSADSLLNAAEAGFRDGFSDLGGQDSCVGKVYLANSNEGYNMPDTVYNKMYEWSAHYDFILPVIGNSIMGLFRYMRECPWFIATVGMDVDQSDRCINLLGSMRKRMDVVLSDYLDMWMAGRTFPKSAVYGLSSKYTDWLKTYPAADIDLDEISAKAEAKEKEYENN